LTRILVVRIIGAACLFWGASPLLAHTIRPGHIDPANDKQVIVLDSQAPYSAVHIPFTLQDGHIYVHALFDGKPRQCMVDTGTNGIMAIKGTGIQGRATGHIVKSLNLDGPDTFGQEIMLHNLQLGSYELQNVSISLMPTPVNPDNALSDGVPLLGDDAFSQIVLTIDYARRELILRQPQYDFTAQRNAPNSVVLDFNGNKYGRDFPCVAGTLRGKPSTFVLDTGFANDYIAVAPQAGAGAVSVHGLKPLGRKWVRTSYALLYLNQVNCTLFTSPYGRKSCLAFQCPAVVFPNIQGRYGASVGIEILKRFRITIDYPRRRMLLEPNVFTAPSRVATPRANVLSKNPRGSQILLGSLLFLGLTGVFWGVEMVDAARRQFPDASAQALWLLLMLLTFVLGALIYHVVGRKQGSLFGNAEESEVSG
jgi:hypothetical protein